MANLEAILLILAGALGIVDTRIGFVLILVLGVLKVAGQVQ